MIIRLCGGFFNTKRKRPRACARGREKNKFNETSESWNRDVVPPLRSVAPDLDVEGARCVTRLAPIEELPVELEDAFLSLRANLERLALETTQIHPLLILQRGAVGEELDDPFSLVEQLNVGTHFHALVVTPERPELPGDDGVRRIRLFARRILRRNGDRPQDRRANITSLLHLALAGDDLRQTPCGETVERLCKPRTCSGATTEEPRIGLFRESDDTTESIRVGQACTSIQRRRRRVDGFEVEARRTETLANTRTLRDRERRRRNRRRARMAVCGHRDRVGMCSRRERTRARVRHEAVGWNRQPCLRTVCRLRVGGVGHQRPIGRIADRHIKRHQGSAACRRAGSSPCDLRDCQRTCVPVAGRGDLH